MLLQAKIRTQLQLDVAKTLLWPVKTKQEFLDGDLYIIYEKGVFRLSEVKLEDVKVFSFNKFSQEIQKQYAEF